MEMSEACCLRAVSLWQSGEVALARFYKSASEGFRTRAMRLAVES